MPFHLTSSKFRSVSDALVFPKSLAYMTPFGKATNPDCHAQMHMEICCYCEPATIVLNGVSIGEKEEEKNGGTLRQGQWQQPEDEGLWGLLRLRSRLVGKEWVWESDRFNLHPFLSHNYSRPSRIPKFDFRMGNGGKFDPSLI